MSADDTRTGSAQHDPLGEPERVIIRDNRKIDPVTGEARKPAAGGDTPPAEGTGGSPGPTDPSEDDVPNAQALLLEERTLDLQRLQAEYANYRKRAERDRLAAGDVAIGRSLAELLPVIDDIDRAREHGDLTGALKAVADKLDGAFGKLGLVAFGEVGDPFDPVIHEAVLHDESDAVTVPTCTTVMRKGYQYRDRLLRPAMVGVTDPLTATPGPTPQAVEDTTARPSDDEAQAQDAPRT